MPLRPGARLGPYEVLDLIGAGGMGEVYKARDTRLDRTVAVKILPADLATDPERRQRFEREARTISQLNHPHICALYDVGEVVLPSPESPAPSSVSVSYLVMEHLAGETLAERLKKGPLPLAQAVDVAAQIGDALAAAHKHGVIHRDLKPGNVMLTRTGTKLLDFGLAKLKGHGEQPALDEAASMPTATDPLTARGTIVGTLPYMAPEQLEGKPADARTDLWALGTILYEMVTGTRAFEGTSSASLIGHIMNTDPPALATRQPLTPPALEHVVRKCLAKQAEDRWASAHDVADELRWILQTSGTSAAVAPGPKQIWWRHGLAIGTFVGVAVLVAATGAYLWGRRATPATARSPIHATINLRPAKQLAQSYRTDFTWTPDGQGLVFGAEEAVRGAAWPWLSRSAHLYVRRLDEGQAQPLAGTEGASIPFVSPDGQWVGFWVEAERGTLWELRKVPLREGGPPVTICQARAPFPPTGGSWGDDGTIVYAFETGGLWAVSAEGGTPRRLTELDKGEVSHRLPHVLPGSRAVLFTIRRTVATWGHEQVGLLELATGRRMVIEEAGADARYAPTGHLVFLRLGTLLAVPFDLATLRVTGGAVALLDQVAQAADVEHPSNDSLAGQFAVSTKGDLAVVRSPGPIGVPPHEVLWVDRRGRQSPLSGLKWPGAPFGSRLSPDGARAVVLVREPTRFDAWVLDLARGALGRLTTGDEVDCPVWSPDRRVVVLARSATSQIVRRVVDRSDREVVVFEAPGHDAGIFCPSSWSAGNVLAVVRQSATRGFDIGVLDMNTPSPEFRELLATPADEMWPAFSPDGKWLAYVSQETGRYEVYVRPYPSMEPKTQVSTQQGMGVIWGANGRELFFIGGERGKYWLTAVRIDTTNGRVRVGPETKLFAATHDAGGLYVGYPAVYYSVTTDGQRFLIHKLPPTIDPPPATSIDLVVNWVEELKAKVPVK